jgi:ferrous iron transport protein A
MAVFPAWGLAGFVRGEYTFDDTETDSQFRFPLPRVATLVFDDLIPLNRLKPGQFAQVGRILGPADHVHRLEEFGLRSGTTIQMFRPGNPCIVRMAGNKVCLRSDESLNVLVRSNGTSC